MPDFPFAIVGFDLDGTLVDSSADLAAAVNHALRRAGRPTLAADRVRGMIGGGARSMLVQALTATGGCDDALLDAAHEDLTAFYADHLVIATRPFPGVVEALDALAERGVTLAVVTNKRERFTHPLLAALNLADRFACVISGDTLALAKPSPAPIIAMIAQCGGGRAAFVGDSRFDVAAAQAAGIPAIVYAGGFRQEPVAALGAEAVIDDFADLIATLERL